MEKSTRLLALDVFRGITIAFMIIVNNPGSWNTVYPPLLHSKWSGCTPTDLVFPFFMFIVGVAMWYSSRKFGHKLSGKHVAKILRRAIVIYLIGLFLNAYSTYRLDLSTIRIMGVLPRIALAYLVASFLVPFFSARQLKIVSAVMLLSYWALLYFFGGDNPFSLEENFARSFDIAVLGINHIPVFHGVKFDQTGLMSTFPSVVNILLGYLAGRMIDGEEERLRAVRKLLIYGTAGIAAALLWSIVLPVNKPLWTSSFVLLTCGFASLFMGILVWIIDIKGLSSWTKPFHVFGINPLFLYFLSEVLAITLGLQIAGTDPGTTTSLSNWLFESVFLPVAGPYSGSLLYALVFALVCWFAGWILYAKKIIIKI